MGGGEWGVPNGPNGAHILGTITGAPSTSKNLRARHKKTSETKTMRDLLHPRMIGQDYLRLRWCGTIFAAVKGFTHRADHLTEICQSRYVPDLYDLCDLAHVAGWELYNLRDLL